MVSERGWQSTLRGGWGVIPYCLPGGPRVRVKREEARFIFENLMPICD